MIFLFTNLFIGKYYQNIYTQLVIAFVCYLLIFIIARDILSVCTYQSYRYYIYILVIFDISFIIYKIKKLMSNKYVPNNKDKITLSSEQSETIDLKSGSFENFSEKSLSDISLSSESNDYKISHDTNSFELDGLFSSSSDDKENSDKKNLSEKSS